MRTYLSCVTAVAAIVAPAPALAGSAIVTVRGADGQPLAGAVVLIEMARPPAGPIKFPWPYVMAQQNIMFVPHVLIVPVGATVAFPNRDKVRHHVYSFSPAKKFDLKLYGRDETRTVTFDKKGVVALGCNIHDAMNGFIIVVDTPFVATTDGSGRVTIPNLPAGAAIVRVWSPSIRATDNMASQQVTVTAAGLTMIYTIRPR